MITRRVCLLLALFATAEAGSAVHAAAPSTAPEWIWADAPDASPKHTCETWQFKRRLTTPSAIRRALLRIAADDCSIEFKLNRHKVLRLGPFCQATELDVTSLLVLGENPIEILAKSTGPSPALAAHLVLEAGSGETRELITDRNWSALAISATEGADHPPKEVAAVSRGNVTRELWGLDRRPATIDPFDNYEQWRQALGDKGAASAPVFWTAPSFEIAQVRAAQPEEGSWVSLAFDPQGRLTIAREDKGLLRMTLAEDSRSITKVETINDELLECRGLLYAHGALYANANNSKGLYRLRDTDGDDKLDDVKLLREFPGGVGHGRNDLALGPDGMIYSIHGDSVDVPTADVMDSTSPFREARRGEKTSEGNLVRTDADGKQWEVVSAGMRNPFGIAFNGVGDSFTYDADAEFDMGAPWYRPTRVLQLRSGADFGWRGVTGKWPPYDPDHADNALAVLDIGKGSPTAVAFGTGAKFPPSYQDALFILDWAYGRVLAVHMVPRGAGYRAQAETFLKGRPLNVTDLAIGPDGAMYLVTGGRKTQSALYRVAYVGAEIAPASLGQHEQECHEQALTARKVLRSLETLHRPGVAAAVDSAWPHLADSDPVIRHAARIAIEHQPVSEWSERALREPQATAALEALLALARSGENDAWPAIIERLVALRIADLEVDQQLAVLHLYHLAQEQAPEAIKSPAAKIIEQLSPAFAPEKPVPLEISPAGSSIHVQRRLANLLVRLGSSNAVDRTMRSLLTSERQEDRLQALFSLRSSRAGWTRESRRAYFAALNDGSRFLGGDGMPRFLTQIRDEAVATLSEAERKELADLLTAPAAVAESDLKLPERPVVKAWSIDDFAAQLAATPPRGDAARGETIFRDALCVRCHRVGARGPAVGPDLTHVAGRFSRRDILESILTPDRVVAENYRNVQVLLNDGRALVGRVLSEGDYRCETLRLAPDPLRPSQVIEINKKEIDKYQLAESSPMPKGLLDSFTAAEVLDLLAYLARGPGQEDSRQRSEDRE